MNNTDEQVSVPLRPLDVLAIGETLIDMISSSDENLPLETHTFQMYPGGQVTNVAVNIARLGGRSALVARVGDDRPGLFLRAYLEQTSVETRYLSTSLHTPTTLVVVTRSHSTPNFTVYRGADVRLHAADLPTDLLPQVKMVHTSLFALSAEPASSHIRAWLKLASEAGCRISLDPNYHPRIWSLPENPLQILSQVAPAVFLTKPSLDDCTRLFGPGLPPEAYAQHFLDLGIQQVALTLGADGVLLANAQGFNHFPAEPVPVVDVTGAGDSLWSGLLLALCDGYTVAEAVRLGLAVAALKIQQVGPLSQSVDRQALYQKLGFNVEEVSYADRKQ